MSNNLQLPADRKKLPRVVLTQGDNLWVWTLVAANGQPMASCFTPFKTRSKCLANLRRTIDLLNIAVVVDGEGMSFPAANSPKEK